MELTGISPQPPENLLICIFVTVWGTPARTGWLYAFHHIFLPLGFLSLRSFCWNKTRTPQSFSPSLFYLLPANSFSDLFGGRKKEDQNNAQEENTALLRPDPHLHRTHSHEKSWSNQNETSENDTRSVNTYLKLCARSFTSIISQQPWEVGYEAQSPYSFPHLLTRQQRLRKVKKLVQLLQQFLYFDWKAEASWGSNWGSQSPEWTLAHNHFTSVLRMQEAETPPQRCSQDGTWIMLAWDGAEFAAGCIHASEKSHYTFAISTCLSMVLPLPCFLWLFFIWVLRSHPHYSFQSCLKCTILVTSEGPPPLSPPPSCWHWFFTVVYSGLIMIEKE